MNVRERPVRERSHEFVIILDSYDRLTALEFRLTPQESVFGDSKPTDRDVKKVQVVLFAPGLMSAYAFVTSCRTSGNRILMMLI